MRSWLMAMGGTAHSEASGSTRVRNRHTTNVVYSERHSARPAGFACSWPGLRLLSHWCEAKSGGDKSVRRVLLAAANAGARRCSSSAIASRRAQRGEGEHAGRGPELRVPPCRIVVALRRRAHCLRQSVPGPCADQRPVELLADDRGLCAVSLLVATCSYAVRYLSLCNLCGTYAVLLRKLSTGADRHLNQGLESFVGAVEGCIQWLRFPSTAGLSGGIPLSFDSLTLA